MVIVTVEDAAIECCSLCGEDIAYRFENRKTHRLYPTNVEWDEAGKRFRTRRDSLHGCCAEMVRVLTSKFDGYCALCGTIYRKGDSVLLERISLRCVHSACGDRVDSENRERRLASARPLMPFLSLANCNAVTGRSVECGGLAHRECVAAECACWCHDRSLERPLVSSECQAGQKAVCVNDYCEGARHPRSKAGLIHA